MHTLRLKISDKIYDKLIWFLSKFGKDEIEIINEDSEFFENQKYLEKELNEILEGKGKFIDFGEMDNRLENIIRKNENSL